MEVAWAMSARGQAQPALRDSAPTGVCLPNKHKKPFFSSTTRPDNYFLSHIEAPVALHGAHSPHPPPSPAPVDRESSASRAPQRFDWIRLLGVHFIGSWYYVDMKKSCADEKVLSYNDVVLRQSDLKILSGPYFLNDRIIEFYFSYLSSHNPSDDILLVPPSISFWITNCEDNESIKDFVEPLNLPVKKLVFFPVNDNDDLTRAEGGSHWSLLVFERSSNGFVHHDSYGGSNRQHAKRLYNAVVRFMGITSTTSCSYSFLDYPHSPQQVNSYDCGLYVVASARAICSWYVSSSSKGTGALWFPDLKEQVTPAAVTEMRKEILKLITERLMKH